MNRIPLWICTIALIATTLDAQWLHQPTPGIPRLADGRPDLAAPAPKASDGKPDLSGIWRINGNRYAANVTLDLKPQEIQPWAAALHRERVENLARDVYTVKCLPGGPIYSHVGALDGFKIVQTPALIVILYPDMNFRQVFLDGRSLPDDPNPSWMGYSIGHWEGDTLVVESTGYNDRSWIDIEGHPHTEALRVTERFRRTEFGHIDLTVMLEDPAIYARPIQIAARMDAMLDTEILEFVCAENEKDRTHLVGQAPNDLTLKIPPEVLSKYVGVYETRNPFVPSATMNLPVSLSGGQLEVDGLFGRETMIPVSKAEFSIGGTSARFADENGVMTLILETVEGEIKAIRK